MRFIENEIFHVYNCGNHKETIFYSRDNYAWFMGKVEKYILPRCMILNWCLMPNHFHFLLYATKLSVQPMQGAKIPTQYVTEGIRLLLSSYAKGINKQLNQSGNLFQQKTKAKCTSHVSDTFKVSDTVMSDNYSDVAFKYIHQNPFKSRLVERMEDWEFSSFRDYINVGKESLCNKRLALELLGMTSENFYEESYSEILDEKVKKIF